MVDVSKIQAGDKGTIEVVFGALRRGQGVEIVPVSALTGDGREVERPEFLKNTPIFVHQERIVTHTPKPREIKVGDEVVCPDNRWGVVRAIENDAAWVRAPTEIGGTIQHLADLKHFVRNQHRT